jgi:aspartyl-tRNA(Asn)/glutamyl-tRNA(Gln) amidotransferase subunit C
VIDLDTVRHVARLARLGLSDDELVTMQAEMDSILGHIEVIQSLDLDGVPPTTHVVDLFNVLGDDVPRPELSADEALREAPRTVAGGFAVSRIG